MAGNGVSSMSKDPQWLPPMLALSGTWDKIVSELYGIFEKDFKQGKPKFQHYMIWWDQRILSGQRFEEGFWHLISRDDKDSGERIPDFRRASPASSDSRTCWTSRAGTVWRSARPGRRGMAELELSKEVSGNKWHGWRGRRWGPAESQGGQLFPDND